MCGTHTTTYPIYELNSEYNLTYFYLLTYVGEKRKMILRRAMA